MCTLLLTQDLVIQQLGEKSKNNRDGDDEEGDGEGKSIAVLLSEGLPAVRNIVKNMKKTNHGEWTVVLEMIFRFFIFINAVKLMLS